MSADLQPMDGVNQDLLFLNEVKMDLLDIYRIWSDILVREKDDADSITGNSVHQDSQ